MYRHQRIDCFFFRRPYIPKEPMRDPPHVVDYKPIFLVSIQKLFTYILEMP